MDTLLSLAPVAAVLVAAYVAWNFLGPRLKARIPSMTMDDVATKVLGDKYQAGKLERQAAKEIKAGNFMAAGRVYEDAGMAQQAVDTYLQGEEYMSAAFVLE